MTGQSNGFNVDGVLCNEGISFEKPVYEVIRLIDGIPLFFEGHMMRLAHSLKLIEAPYTLDFVWMYQQIIRLAEANALTHHNVRIEIGDAEGWHCVLFPAASSYPEQSVYAQGVRTVTTEIVRHNPHAKVVNPAYVKHIAEVKLKTDAYEVIIMDDHQKLAEGSRSNLFFIKDGCLYSARAEDILMGITRLKILEAAERLGIPLIEQDLYLSDIKGFEACFISGTSIYILPIARLDDVTFASANHPLLKALSDAFLKCVDDDLKETRQKYEFNFS